MEGDDYDINIIAEAMRLPEVDFSTEQVDSISTRGVRRRRYDSPTLSNKPYAYGDTWVLPSEDDTERTRRKVIKKMGESKGPWPSWADDWPWWLKTMFTI